MFKHLASPRPMALARLWGWVAGCLAMLAAGASPAPTRVPTVGAEVHRDAAQRQAQGHTSSRSVVERWCSTASSPASAELAVQRLQAAEAEYRTERMLPRPRADQLRLAVVRRSCAAYHASRLLPGESYPIWLYTHLQIKSVRPAAAGFEVQAVATTVDGPVVNSRITFARGLHHACFAATDAAGVVTCTMVDTHPHGPGVGVWAEAHEGPVVATLAGKVAPEVVELPSVSFRDLPAFANLPGFR